MVRLSIPKSVLALVVSGGTPVVCCAQPVQWTVGAGGNGRYYEAVAHPQACWTQARADAMAGGGDLVTITSAPEQQFVEEVLRLSNPPTGAQFVNLIELSPRVYAWANGEPMAFSRWFPGEPNDGFGGIESVGSILWTRDQPANGRSGFWNDVPSCLFGRPGYVQDYGPGGYIVEYPCVPSVVSDPASRNACGGATVSFVVGVGTGAGSGPFAHRWHKDGMPIDAAANPSAATASLTLTDIQLADEGAYRCIVTNACGSTESETAMLTVCACLECAADFNQDGGIDGSDVDAFFARWEVGHCDADTNADGGVDGADVDSFFLAWEQGGC